MKAYSSGFSWANFDLGVITIPAKDYRRKQAKGSPGSKPSAGEQDLDESSDRSSGSCDVSLVLPPAEIVINCLCILLAVSAGRQLLVSILVNCVHKDAPATLFFPAWEGPGGVRVCMCACTCERVCESARAHACMSVFASACACVCVCACVHCVFLLYQVTHVSPQFSWPSFWRCAILQ